MIKYKSYKDECWICGELATSGEHIYKRTDLQREFSATNFKKGISREIRHERKLRLNSPKSKHAKFKNSLCSKCNNETSQPFDLAYDQFISFYKENEDEIVGSRTLNLENIFGADWKSSLENLKKYYVKHIGCRLSQNGIEILSDIVEYINGESQLYSVILNFYTRYDIYDFLKFVKSRKHEQSSVLGLGGIYGNFSPSRGSWYNLHSGYIYRGLALHYYYSNEQNEMKSNLDFGPSITLPTFRNEIYDNHMREEYGR